MIDPVPVNPQGKTFTWSYSAMQQYFTCPMQYAAQRFYETTKSEPTIATEWGTRVHKELEERIRDGKPLSSDCAAYEKYARAIESAEGETFCEKQFCLNTQLQPVSWFAKDAWCRGVVDVLRINRKKATLLDWKTGKVKDDDLQLKVFACLVSIHYPEIEEFEGRFIWLKHDEITGVTLKKAELGPIWGETIRKVLRMQEAWALGVFNCNPSGLCRGFCAVEECAHWRPKR